MLSGQSKLCSRDVNTRHMSLLSQQLRTGNASPTP